MSWHNRYKEKGNVGYKGSNYQNELKSDSVNHINNYHYHIQHYPLSYPAFFKQHAAYGAWQRFSNMFFTINFGVSSITWSPMFAIFSGCAGKF